MRKVSALFKQTMEERRDFYASANITFADGTELPLEKRDFALTGNTVTESAESTSFPLGILAGRRISITLENSDDRWSKYDFFGAKIALKTSFDLPDGTTESLNIGTFTVISPESYGETVSITAMDGSYKADKPYTTAQAYPMTAGVALRDACQACDIDLATPSFANDNFLIQQAQKDITFRQFIGCIAMLAGGNAVMDEFDRLTIKSYDFSPFERFGQSYNGGVFDVLSDERYLSGDTASGGSFNPWEGGDAINGGAFGDRDDIHVLYQFSGVPVVEADDVVITGVQLTNTDNEGNQTAHLYGSEGYVLSLENPLTIGQESAAAALIGAKIVGLRFRPFSGNHIALPTAQFMDLAWILDRKDNGHQSVITDVDFSYFGYTVLKCAADSPIRNSSTYYGQATKAVVQARQMVEKERTDRQKAIETLAQELAQSSGLYMTQKRQDDGSTIYYMHDKPALENSAIVWKLTANALGISTDGGKSYPYGLDVTGTAILNRIYTIGLNADYIKTGRFEVHDESGKLMFLVDCNTGEVQIVAKSFSLIDGASVGANSGIYMQDGNLYVSFSAAKGGSISISTPQGKETLYANADTGEVRICADSFALSDGVTVGANNGIYMQNGNLYVSFSAARGGTLTLGGQNNTSGKLKVRDAYDTLIGTWDNSGIYVYDGDISTRFGDEISRLIGGTLCLSVDNSDIGIIGTSVWHRDVTRAGMVLGIEDGAFCGIGRYESGTKTYAQKLTYYSEPLESNEGGYFEADRLYATCSMQFYEKAIFGGLSSVAGSITSYTDGLAIRSEYDKGLFLGVGEENYLEIDDQAITLWNTGSTTVHCYNDIDMHNWRILNSSDERLKTNIQPFDSSALDIIDDIGIYSFDWAENGDHTKAGFIAQQLESVNEDFVHIDAVDGHYSTQDVQLIPYLVKAVQELSARVQTLETEVAELRGENATIKKARKRVSKKWTPTYPDDKKRQYAESIRPKRKQHVEVVHPSVITSRKGGK